MYIKSVDFENCKSTLDFKDKILKERYVDIHHDEAFDFNNLL